MYQADPREAFHLACDDAPTDRCYCAVLELRALREAVPAFIEVVSWPAPLRTNPAEAGLAEPFGLLAPAPHAVEDVECVPYHWTGAVENAPVLEDSAHRRQFRKYGGGRCLRTTAPKLFGEAEATPKSSDQLSLGRNGYGQAD